MVYFRAHMSFQALDDDDDEEEPFGDEAAIEHTKTDTIAAAVVQPLLQALETFGCTSKDQQPPQDDSSVAIFKDREPPQGFFLRCMRCLGSFSLVDGCILVLAGQRACALLAAGLRQWRGAPEAVACGLEVLSNLAAIEDDELDEQVGTCAAVVYLQNWSEIQVGKTLLCGCHAEVKRSKARYVANSSCFLDTTHVFFNSRLFR